MELPKIGAFSPCTIVWDEKEGKYIDATKDDIYKCCKKRCNDYEKDCLRVCKSGYPLIKVPGDCQHSCGILTDVCNRVCETGRFDYSNRYFDECMNKSGCIENDTISEDCIIKNKKDIIDCCKKSCPKKKDINCDDYCNTSFEIHLARSKNRPKIENINQLKDSTVIKSREYIFSIYTFLSLLILVYFTIIFIHLKDKKIK